MQTTTLLTEQELKILNDLKQPEGATLQGVLTFGIIMFVMGALTSLFAFMDIFAMALAGPILLIGIITIIVAIRKKRRNKDFFNNPPYGNLKQVLTDHLLRVELVGNQVLRYHFQGYQMDFYIAGGQGYHPSFFRHKRPIEDVNTLTNIPVRISYVAFQPQENVLLDIVYGQSTLTEAVVPLDQEDRDKMVKENFQLAGWLFLFGIGIALLIGCFTSFKSDIFPLTLAFSAGPIALISLWIIIDARWLARNADTKIIIRTTVSEILGIRVRSGKTTVRNSFLRLGDGSLMHIPNQSCHPGAKIEIQFVANKAGKRSRLIDLKTY
ncbi:hypothetical protein [Chitinophaga rhizophila]|uniref:Uncharacterized protein n=1 Tax=Chitinophaga rhizophila TaxID=2866212 RepID=A0ABS7G582_9BACT|nr:hypothetical protein [Chitinophaga rhizophila]MBW8682792.1 hypothetical protein [Chitinophaga rhizophila]